MILFHICFPHNGETGRYIETECSTIHFNACCRQKPQPMKELYDSAEPLLTERRKRFSNVSAQRVLVLPRANGEGSCTARVKASVSAKQQVGERERKRRSASDGAAK